MALKIDEKTAKMLYDDSPEWFQEQLKKEFGEDLFKKKDFRDIKTFEDACKELGITNDSCRPIFDEEEDPDEIAYKKLKVIIAAINQGWKPNWNDSNEKKWYPWFKYLASGFGFYDSFYAYYFAHTSVGSRLCFESQEKATFAGTQFIELYNQFLN